MRAGRPMRMKSIFCVADLRRQQYERGSESYESSSSLALKPGYKTLFSESVSFHPIFGSGRRLDTSLEQAGVTKVDVLSADLEGRSNRGSKSLDLNRFDPHALVIENFLNDSACRVQMKNWGYALWCTFKPIEVYVA